MSVQDPRPGEMPPARYPETADDYVRLAAVRQYTEAVRDTYDAFINVGFNEEQATDLTLAWQEVAHHNAIHRREM